MQYTVYVFLGIVAGIFAGMFGIGGLIGANLAQSFSDPLLKKLFGVFLLFVSLEMILGR